MAVLRDQYCMLLGKWALWGTEQDPPQTRCLALRQAAVLVAKGSAFSHVTGFLRAMLCRVKPSRDQLNSRLQGQRPEAAPVQPSRIKAASCQAAPAPEAGSQPAHGLSDHMATAGKWALVGAVALAGLAKVCSGSPVHRPLAQQLLHIICTALEDALKCRAETVS